MNRFLIKITMLLALFTMAFSTATAQNSAKVESTFKEIMKKYEGTEGVECVSVVKGQGLDLIKAMLRKELGRSFMKGVTSINIVEYSEASEDACASLRKDLDVFLSLLNEFEVGEEMEFADNDYLRCFADDSEDVLSDFVIAMEHGEVKMLMYMAGEIRLE